jgi:Tfp pilus assembly protein PilO
MSRLSAQAQLYIAIALIAVVSLAVVFLGILPLFQEASTVQGEIRTEESNLSAAEALLARRESAKMQSAANEVELMRIANQIPDSPQLPSVIIELQDVANLSGVDFQSLAPGEPAPAVLADGTTSDYSVVPMVLLIRGDWAELIDYLRRIDALERGVRATEISFVYVGSVIEEGLVVTPAYVEASVTLEVYTMASVPPAGDAAVPSTTTTTTP